MLIDPVAIGAIRRKSSAPASSRARDACLPGGLRRANFRLGRDSSEYLRGSSGSHSSASKLIPSYLNKLEEDNKRLRAIANQSPVSGSERNTNLSINDHGQDESPPLSKEESNLFNPLFDGQTENPVHERSLEPGFIGEASCDAFSNRLLSCLDETYTPTTAGLSNYHRLNTRDRSQLHRSVEFPERMHVKLLLNVARRFIGNYHPLFLEVTFMREIDAVYRRELIPSMLWLCKFYALMALGEIYTHRRGVGDNNRVPGTDYYVRAVNLLQENQDYYEEPSLMQVEVLTLLVRR